MDPSKLPTMQSGLGSGMEVDANEEAKNNFIATSMGLLRVFTEEAMKTAGEIAMGEGRTVVEELDTVMALKYQARMFFQRVENLDGRVQEAIDEFWADIEEEEGEEEDEEEDEEESEAEGEELQKELTPERIAKGAQMRRNVQAICASWSCYNPTDPVLMMIKHAIDTADAKLAAM